MNVWHPSSFTTFPLDLLDQESRASRIVEAGVQPEARTPVRLSPLEPPTIAVGVQEQIYWRWAAGAAEMILVC